MRNKQKNGFTLVELLIAMVVGLTILLAISSMMDIGLKSSSGVGRRVLTQQDARAVLDLMAMEIGMASFNPNMNNSTWSGNMSGTCNSISMTQANKGIQVATADQIGVAMDLVSTCTDLSCGTCCPGKEVYSGVIGDVPNEYIRYNYTAANGTITRIVCGGVVPVSTDVILGGTGSSTIVRNQEEGVSLFQYLDITGNPTTTIANIRRIRINIIADVATQQGNAFKTTRRTYSTDVLVRNHAMSP
jgi:prepilin-type N-terminal cleavage/methylation domain-containing protein